MEQTNRKCIYIYIYIVIYYDILASGIFSICYSCQESLGGNSLTVMIANISSAAYNLDESAGASTNIYYEYYYYDYDYDYCCYYYHY